MRILGHRIDPLDLVLDLVGGALIIGGTALIVGALLAGGEVFVMFIGVVIAFAGWSMVKESVTSFRRRRRISKDRQGVPPRSDAWWQREDPEP